MTWPDFFAGVSVAIVILLAIGAVQWWLEKNGYTGQGPGVE